MITLLLAAALVGLLAGPLVRRRAGRRRLSLLLPKAARGRTRPRDPRIVLSAAAGLAVVGLIGTWWALPAGAVAAYATNRFLLRREPAEARVARLRAVADLPLCADLLAAALEAGGPVDRAAEAVADALGGPLGDRLARVARSLRLGAQPVEAWAQLSDVAGAKRIVSAAIRSSNSGSALAGVFFRLAGELRDARKVTAEAAAHRAAVLIVLPLGMCFLPAFVLAGLVPVIVAVLDDVL
jgi:pilus assembly protein TadC